ncbi:MAG: TRAP transporter substrate-binding protein DctP [Spirochaetes bacterium]|nr:TRAP transporter substrate-binding protein DctP [Spirochaetota bacterium]
MEKGRSLLFLCFLLIFPLNTPLQAQTTQKKLLRISVENTLSHVQTRNVYRFADTLSKRIPLIQVEVYPEARLFRDRDVLNAVHVGKVEMAVPGTWNLEPFFPDLGIFLLPFLYGRSIEQNHTLADGVIGRKLKEKLEVLYNLTIPGLWMDLGHAHSFTLAKPITRLEDFKNLRIRVAGGRANELRLITLGAYAVTIPWPELIERLRTHRVEGILTTYETVRSAELWNYGVRYAFEDNQYFPMYIPMVNRDFWERLTKEEQSVFQQIWNEHALIERAEALLAQMEAKDLFIRNGGRVLVPSLSEIRRIRQSLLDAQPNFIQQLQIDPDLVRDAERELGS